MQKHILLTESLKSMIPKTSINKTKDKNNRTTEYNAENDYSKTEESKLNDQLLENQKTP